MPNSEPRPPSRVQEAERERDLALQIAREALGELTDDQLLRLRRRLDKGAADDGSGEDSAAG